MIGRMDIGSVRAIARQLADMATSPVGSVLRFSSCGSRLALTFDDGPDPEVTPRLLGILGELDIQATFFMLCSRVRQFPEIAELVRADGHEVALHGLDHRRMTGLPQSEAYDALAAGKRELEAALGITISWYRPPYGAHNLRIWRQVRSLGMQMVMWGPTLRDSKSLSPEERWRSAEARPGDIVLAHDGVAGRMDGVDDPSPAPIDRAVCARMIIERYLGAGLIFSTLSELAAAGRPVRGARWTR